MMFREGGGGSNRGAREVLRPKNDDTPIKKAFGAFRVTILAKASSRLER